MTAEMAAFCREVNNLYQALGYSSVNRALDKPIHQHDVPVADTLKLVQSCSSWCNDWSKLRSEKMNLVACGSIGCISQCTLNCLKKSSLALKKTVELSNADDVVNKDNILTTSILSESSIEHSFGSNRQKSQVECLTAEEYILEEKPNEEHSSVLSNSIQICGKHRQIIC